MTNIYNLKKYTEYVITLVCQTSRGQGPASSPKTIRTQEDGEKILHAGLFQNTFRDFL